MKFQNSRPFIEDLETYKQTNHSIIIEIYAARYGIIEHVTRTGVWLDKSYIIEGSIQLKNVKLEQSGLDSFNRLLEELDGIEISEINNDNDLIGIGDIEDDGGGNVDLDDVVFSDQDGNIIHLNDEERNEFDEIGEWDLYEQADDSESELEIINNGIERIIVKIKDTADITSEEKIFILISNEKYENYDENGEYIMNTKKVSNYWKEKFGDDPNLKK